jgi:hypothetical protein
LRRVVVAVLIAAVATFVAMAVSIGAAGGGHGTYVPAKILFPWTMLLAEVRQSSITEFLLAVALVQPIVYLTLVLRKAALWKAIAIAHAIAAAAALLYPTSTF